MKKLQELIKINFKLILFIIHNNLKQEFIAKSLGKFSPLKTEAIISTYLILNVISFKSSNLLKKKKIQKKMIK
jgi:hypothetical protein